MHLFANRYVIERVLGEGGMGVVYLVSDPLSTPPGRRLALKQIRPERLTPTVRAAMAREFRVLTRLRHPNLVEVYDFSTEPGCWFTMEYIEGQELRAASLPPRDLIESTVQTCRALDYIHSRGLVHLDVKPSNILVARRPGGELSVKLMDFGVASELRESAPSGYTLGFVAPEILDGRAFDGRADLYSLGMTLLSLSESEPSDTWDVTIQVRGLGGEVGPSVPPELGHLPQGLAPVVERLVRLDPTERFGSAAQVIEALSTASGVPYALETPATRTGTIHSARLTGRDEELAHLQALYAAVRGGAGRHVVIEAPSGLGKSRLVKELRVHAQLDGALVVVAAGAPGGPSHHAVSALVGQLGGAGAAERALAPHHVAELARLSFGLDARAGAAIIDDLGSAASRSRLHEAVIALVGSASHGRPVVVVVEDVDFVDDASAQLLRSLRARIAAGDLPGVLLVLTARAARSFAVPEILRLAPLLARHVREIVEDVLGAGTAPEAFVARVTELSRGNGFFVSELLKLAADRELVARRPDGSWWCDPEKLRDVELPSTAAETVAERVRLLPDPLRRLTWLAALLGPSFEPAALEAAHGEAAPAELHDLVGRMLIVAEGRTFRFAHAEVQGAALRDARASGEWETLNGSLAEILERQGGHPADVARLFLDSGERHRALPHLEGAAALAEAVHDYATAVSTYDGALALADELGGSRLRGLHRRRLAAIRAGGLGEVDPRAQQALAAAHDDLRVELDVRLELARIASRRGRFADAIAQAQTVLERVALLGGARAGARLAAEAHRVAGLARLSLGQLPAAVADLDAAVAVYEQLHDDAGRSGALNDRGFVHGYAGNYGAALADHEEALAGLRRLPAGIALDALAATENNLGFAAWNLGKYDVARAHLDEALALRRRLSDLHGEGVTRNNIGNVLRHQGDLEGAIGEYEAAISLCRRSGNVLYEAIALNNLGQIEEERDHLGRAEAMYRLALDLALSLGDRIREGDNLGNLGVCLLLRGRPRDARELLRRAVALRREIGDRAYLILDLSYLALAELALGERALAQAAAAEALATLEAGQEGTEQVQAVYLNGYKVFLAAGERDRALALLVRAGELVAARLGTSRDAGLRLRVNREIVTCCRAEGLVP